MPFSSTRTDASCSSTRPTKPIRPLPDLPPRVGRHAPTRSITEAELLIRLRPLPSPPCESPTSSEHTHNPSAPHISITPPTPLPSSSAFASPSVPRQERPRLGTLQTSPAALLPRVREDGDDGCSPITPAMPQAPSPTTARRRQMSKIRRHLGAGVPSELFLPQTRAAKIEQAKTSTRTGDSETESEEEEELEWHVAQDAPVFRFVEKDDSCSPWTAIQSYNPASQRRSTLKKWVWEKDGRRWDEKNYDEILDTLRKL